MSKEWWLRGRRRAKRSYSTLKVRRGDLFQGKEQQLCFAGAAVKRYPTSKVRETQVRRWVLQEGRHTETIITENLSIESKCEGAVKQRPTGVRPRKT